MTGKGMGPSSLVESGYGFSWVRPLRSGSLKISELEGPLPLRVLSRPSPEHPAMTRMRRFRPLAFHADSGCTGSLRQLRVRLNFAWAGLRAWARRRPLIDKMPFLEGKMPRNQTERGEAARAMYRLLAGGWVAQIIHTAAELGLADHFGEEARDVASLASATATHPPSLWRL